MATDPGTTALVAGLSAITSMFGGGQPSTPKIIRFIKKYGLKNLRGMQDEIEGYDPEKQSKYAIEQASEVASQTLAKALKRIKAGSGPAGTGDSEFHVSSQRAVNDAFDPLKAFAANEMAMAPMRKVQMLSALFGTPPGQMASTYFNTASAPDQSGAMGLLSAAIQRLMQQRGGAGGRGDTAGGNPDGTSGNPGSSIFGYLNTQR